MKDALLLLNRFAPRNLAVAWSPGCAEGRIPTWPNFGTWRALTTQQLHPAALPVPGAVWWKRNTVCLRLTKSFCVQAAPSTLTLPRKICVWCQIKPRIASVWDYLWNNIMNFTAHHRLYSLLLQLEGLWRKIQEFWESKKSGMLRLEASKGEEGNPTGSQFHHFGIDCQPH